MSLRKANFRLRKLNFFYSFVLFNITLAYIRNQASDDFNADKISNITRIFAMNVKGGVRLG